MAWSGTAGTIATGYGTSTSVSYPSGIQVGDLLVITGRSDATASNMAASGFTAESSDHFPLLTKKASGSETGSVTLSWTSAGNYSIVMIRLRDSGAVAFSPAVSQWNGTTNPLVITPPSYSSMREVTFVTYSDVNATTWTTPPTGFTNLATRTASPSSFWVGFKENQGASSFSMTADHVIQAYTARFDSISTSGLFFGSNF